MRKPLLRLVLLLLAIGLANPGPPPALGSVMPLPCDAGLSAEACAAAPAQRGARCGSAADSQAQKSSAIQCGRPAAPAEGGTAERPAFDRERLPASAPRGRIERPPRAGSA